MTSPDQPEFDPTRILSDGEGPVGYEHHFDDSRVPGIVGELISALTEENQWVSENSGREPQKIEGYQLFTVFVDPDNPEETATFSVNVRRVETEQVTELLEQYRKNN